MKLRWECSSPSGSGAFCGAEDGRVVAVVSRQSPRRFTARLTVAGFEWFTTGHSIRAAADRMSTWMDRRSVGLFGVDDLEIEPLPACK